MKILTNFLKIFLEPLNIALLKFPLLEHVRSELTAAETTKYNNFSNVILHKFFSIVIDLLAMLHEAHFDNHCPKAQDCVYDLQLFQAAAELPGIGSDKSDVVVAESENAEHVQAVQPTLIQLGQVIVLQLPTERNIKSLNYNPQVSNIESNRTQWSTTPVPEGLIQALPSSPVLPSHHIHT